MQQEIDFIEVSRQQLEKIQLLLNCSGNQVIKQGANGLPSEYNIGRLHKGEVNLIPK